MSEGFAGEHGPAPAAPARDDDPAPGKALDDFGQVVAGQPEFPREIRGREGLVRRTGHPHQQA